MPANSCMYAVAKSNLGRERKGTFVLSFSGLFFNSFQPFFVHPHNKRIVVYDAFVFNANVCVRNMI